MEYVAIGIVIGFILMWLFIDMNTKIKNNQSLMVKLRQHE
ncbi:hypothetical protein SEA_KEELAN_146 [Gordonia phage Keelan]|nr:hypothetical protein SEA_KEELAN_146 [Gordonia phage Keelan]